MSADEEQAVAVQRDGSIATIRLLRDAKRNSWTPSFGAGVTAAFEEVAADDGVRAVILDGGSSFCSGADLKAGIITADDLGEILEQHFNPVIRAVLATPQPIVAAVRGMAIGAGWSLALACDLVVASSDAVFTVPFTRLGVCPDAAVTALMPALVGRQRAAELMLLADRIDAATAAEWGMINRLVGEDEVAGTARQLAERLATGAPLALAAAKRLIAYGSGLDLHAQIDRETEEQRKLGGTQDIQEAVAAFGERRQPEFQGR